MQVNKVTATVRYTQDTGKGAWKSLELGCEASINEREDWLIAQATLYGQLAQQFRELWARNGTAPEGHQEGHQINGERSAVQSSPDSQQAPDHFCQEHGVPFVARKGKNGATFYSHRQGDGWHNEK
jgi:hypothetical protein